MAKPTIAIVAGSETGAAVMASGVPPCATPAPETNRIPAALKLVPVGTLNAATVVFAPPIGTNVKPP